MTNPVFLFAIHNHQPVGNFPAIYERAFRECYRPLLEELLLHPSLKFSLHFSGPLLERMEEKEKDCLEILREMTRRGQAEILGGGFYEPILAVIPEEDRQGQLRMMSAYLEAHFGQKPRGIWLTERIWEPHLAETLHRAGIEYTLLDEEHFLQAGFRNLHASAITEEGGHPLRLFPIDKKLRYMIPFQELGSIASYFQEIGERGGAAILGDDGEKFGLWPGTHNLVYKEKWLRNFLNFLEDRAIETMTYSEYLDRHPPAVRVYLPPASYEEMTEWVLGAEDQRIFKSLRSGLAERERRFLRGGYFREFFLKYPESDHFHKRMLRVSRDVRNSADETARKELYKAQSNDAVWHGIFGGLYLPHLRQAAYSHLIRAEKRLPAVRGWSKDDYDLDGRPEFMFRGPVFQAFVKPSSGGAVTEIDHLGLARNLTDVLGRRKEFYHDLRANGEKDGKSIHELAKELPPGAAELFIYDSHARLSFVDRFFGLETNHVAPRDEPGPEAGDFLGAEYESKTEKDCLQLFRQGRVRTGETVAEVCVRKTLRLCGPKIIGEIEIENRGSEAARFIYGSEWNFSARPEETEAADGAVFLFNRRLAFSTSPAAEIRRSSIRTVSQSEEGFDVIHQGMTLLPVWPCLLAAGEKSAFRVTLAENPQ